MNCTCVFIWRKIWDMNLALWPMSQTCYMLKCVTCNLWWKSWTFPWYYCSVIVYLRLNCDICNMNFFVFWRGKMVILNCCGHTVKCVKHGSQKDCWWTLCKRWFTTKWMSTGCTVKCDPGMMHSNGAERYYYCNWTWSDEILIFSSLAANGPKMVVQLFVVFVIC